MLSPATVGAVVTGPLVAKLQMVSPVSALAA